MSPYAGMRPIHGIPGVNRPAGRDNSVAGPVKRTASGPAGSASNLGEAADKEADEDSMHLCFDDDASETSSLETWVCGNRESDTEESVQEMGNEDGKPEEDSGYRAQQEHLTREMNQLIEQNKRRNELAQEQAKKDDGREVFHHIG